MTDVDVVDLRGDAAACGRDHGRLRRHQIGACIDLYRLVLGRSDDELLHLAVGIAATVRTFSPGIAAEIDAIAEGAGIDSAWIYVLNARSELMASTRDGCTTMFAPAAGLLGQTWDWIDASEPLLFVARTVAPDGTVLATLTEPGIVAKIGVNDAGLGVCLNFLYAPGRHEGVPVHVLLRALLGCRTLADARTVLRRAGVGRAANVLVGTAAGPGLNVEYTGLDAVVEELGDQPFAHTNHVTGRPETAGGLYDNSRARAVTARGLLAEVHDVASLTAALDDRSHPHHPICAPYRPYQGVQVGTTATVILDLAARHLHVRRGPHPGTALQRIDLDR